MVVSGKEVEGFRLKCAFVGGFADAGLAEKDGLAALADGVADGGEFFESLDHDRRALEMRSG